MMEKNSIKKDRTERDIESPSEEEKDKQRRILDKLTSEIYSDFEDFLKFHVAPVTKRVVLGSRDVS